MFQKQILLIGGIVTAGILMTSQARAGIFDGVGAFFDRDAAAHRIVGPTMWYGTPGYAKPIPIERAYIGAPGPGRHVVCADQARYDRREAYVGSHRICWVEAR